ncbi:hypothetical protein [Aeromonas sp. MrichA-1]|uniref:hypothetical protein n=1 Tax=Aeromonas sp. MrichA-1 TaxID=2823362 RepID=UPI001B334231|nr:hypothetical protein [Aeromonas sp. MrichA-1]MBP4081567.1 hypothetical protein [Aeromonas sp. MrichA-1]
MKIDIKNASILAAVVLPIGILSFIFPDFVLQLIAGAVILLLSFFLFGRVRQIIIDNDFIVNENKRIKAEFDRCSAELISVGINTDYSFPFYKPENKSESDLITQEDLSEARLLNDLYDGTEIKYRYEYKGDEYISRSIGIIKEDSDKNLALKVKGRFNIYVDKNDPGLCYIRPVKDSSIKKHFASCLLNELPLAIVILSVLYIAI